MLKSDKYREKILLGLAVLLILIGACGKTNSRVPAEKPALRNDSVQGLVVADTIIYDVIIRNPNPDDPWANHCLAGLNYSMLIDSIFDMIYAKRTTAFNHETGEKLTPKQVKRIETEAGFKRENIGMIQFTEAWYLNPEDGTMTKKVLSMVLGINYYANGGELMGHKALLRVVSGSGD